MNRIMMSLVVLAASLPAFSHHSNSAYRVTEVISLTGTVREWRWVNPHTWLFVVVEDENGEQQEWALEGRAPGILTRAGWNPEVFQPGETVMVYGSPAKDGSAEAIIARVTKADGTILGNSPDYFSGAEGPAAPSVASAGTTPDFSGVYYPYRPDGGGGMGAGTATPTDSPPPPPARSAPISDGSLGGRRTGGGIDPLPRRRLARLQRQSADGRGAGHRAVPAARLRDPGNRHHRGRSRGLYRTFHRTSRSPAYAGRQPDRMGVRERAVDAVFRPLIREHRSVRLLQPGRTIT